MFSSKCNESFKIATPVGAAEKKLPGLSAVAVASAILLLLAAALFALPGCGSSNPEADAVSKAKVGDVVQFGDYQWRVLAIEGGKALIITEDVIDVRAYNEEKDDTTWENCTLRSYLNGEFYNGFNDDQKKAIADTKNSNPDNPDYGTPGGNETTDKAFCLSLEEADKYFSSDDDRIAKAQLPSSNEYSKDNGQAYHWWLRTPGRTEWQCTDVAPKGDASRSGNLVNLFGNGDGGVRPAMWVNL